MIMTYSGKKLPTIDLKKAHKQYRELGNNEIVSANGRNEFGRCEGQGIVAMSAQSKVV